MDKHRESRALALDKLRAGEHWDILVIGGGITGAGIALEAAKRGQKVLLVEQRDFAWGTSSRSSKMVHGGLRYLASGDLRLTRDAVRERKRLLTEAPGLVEPLHFFMPHYQGGFPGPRLFGQVLSLYDAMAGAQNHEFYPASATSLWVSGLKTEALVGGTRFADAVVDDARLVLRVLHEARAQGALTLNYLKALTTKKGEAQLQDSLSGEIFTLNAKVIVQATGVWTDQLRATLGNKSVIRPLRGSHLIVPFWRLPVACALSFSHPKDKRPVFVFPWQGVTVIGTTDLDHGNSLEKEARISQAEVEYLLSGLNHALPQAKLTKNDIQASIAGVRPVVAGSQKDPSKEKREHAIWDDGGVISVAGGKLTTFRLIALDVLKAAKPYLGKLPVANKTLFTPPTLPKPAALSHSQWQRLCGHYGDKASEVLALSSDPVAHTDTLWGELIWALEQEAVEGLDDLLLRRTRLGLLLKEGASELKAPLAALCARVRGWDSLHFAAKWRSYQDVWQKYYSL